jgi:hypothetical protein
MGATPPAGADDWRLWWVKVDFFYPQIYADYFLIFVMMFYEGTGAPTSCRERRRPACSGAS